MRKHELYTDYHDQFEYFEAMEFFNDRCGEFVGYYA